MSEGVEELPDDVEALKAMIIAERLRSARLPHLLDVLNRMHFGKRSEKIDSGQLALALEDRDVSMAEAELLVEQGEEATGIAPPRRKRAADEPAPRCRRIFRVTRSRSRRRPAAAQAAAVRCTGSARIGPNDSTSSPPNIASS